MRPRRARGAPNAYCEMNETIDSLLRSLEVVANGKLCRTRKLNVLQRAKGARRDVVAIDELLRRASVEDVVEIDIGLDGMAIRDMKLAPCECVPLDQPWAPDLPIATICIREA